jgi:neutral ceramidase
MDHETEGLLAPSKEGEKSRLIRRQPSSTRIWTGILITLSILAFTWGFSQSSELWRLTSCFRGRLETLTKDKELYLLGVGKADITGPVVEINMMGYANTKQLGTGLRQRLYSRAFIVGDANRPEDRFVYLILDTQSGDTAVRYGILSGLKVLGDEYSIYGQQNVAVTGTHSHSGPGGWLNYLLPQITSKGFDHQGFRAIVDGAILSIKRAHENLQPGYLSVGATKIKGANINRSLYAYMANSEKERSQYNISTEDDGSVDKDLTLLKFQRASDGKSIGVLTWFATHGTSMLGNQTLITGDNKGVSAYLFEKSVRHSESAAPGFVAGFSQANVGDTSPNVLGGWCEDGSGEPCSYKNSSCPNGGPNMCYARGPHFRAQDGGVSSCFEIGKRQFEPARALFDTELEPVRGSWVKSFHDFHDMASFTFALTNGTTVKTCPAALGYSFAAGTWDWPGTFNFTQHESDPSNTSPMWRAVSFLLKPPSDEQRACHGAKPILLDVGEMRKPYQWAPNVVDIQALRVGQLVIIVSASEASTMAGRRWRDAVKAHFRTEDSGGPIVVLGGPANSYAHYVTTEEEYAIQRFEGASTLYGPHTLAAYINATITRLPYLDAKAARPPHQREAEFPPDNSNRSLSFITGVVRDGAPIFKRFGDVLEDVREVYSRRARVTARFVGANPRNNLRLEGTYAAVEKLGNGGWEMVRDDADWSLVFEWARTSEVLATSEVTITWETEEDAEEGVYRLRYFGDAKEIGGGITAFEGTSGTFRLGK